MSTKRFEATELSKTLRVRYIPELNKIAVPNLSAPTHFIKYSSKNHKKFLHVVEIDNTNNKVSAYRTKVVLIEPKELRKYFLELRRSSNYWTHQLKIAEMNKVLYEIKG